MGGSWGKRLVEVRGINRVFGYMGRSVRHDAASFFGAVICLTSLFVPWVFQPLSYTRFLGHPPLWLLRMKTEWSFLDLLQDPDFTLVMALFLVGTIGSLFFRWGIVLQAIGLLGFLMIAPGHFTPSLPTTSMNLTAFNHALGPGYFIALAGVLTSAFLVRNFWWQRSTSGIVPSISRIAALAPNSTRAHRSNDSHR